MDESAPMLPGMPADQPRRPLYPPPVVPRPVDPGFSTTEKLLGAAAAYKAPLASSIAAAAMLRQETDSTRRDQLTKWRTAALVWWGAGAAIAAILLVIFVSVAASHGAGGGCKGGVDRLDPLGATFQSTDNVHWTATYPCQLGGSKTVPIAKRNVPGVGG